MIKLFSELSVTADTRERDPERIRGVKVFVESQGGGFEVEGLPNNGGCDYRVTGTYKDSEINLGIEYKTLVDFTGSYKKLPDRFHNAYELYDSVALVLEVPKYSFNIDDDGFHGTIRNPRVHNGSADVLKYGTFQGVLQSIARSGVYVVRVQSSAEFPYALGWLINYISNPIHSMMGWSENTYQSQYLSSLSQIPGVGVKSATKIMGKYPRYRDLVSTSPKELGEFLGSPLGNKVYGFLHGTPKWEPLNTLTHPVLGDLILEFVDGEKLGVSYSRIKSEFEEYGVGVVQGVLLDLSCVQVKTGRKQLLKKYFEGDITMYRVK